MGMIITTLQVQIQCSCDICGDTVPRLMVAYADRSRATQLLEEMGWTISSQDWSICPTCLDRLGEEEAHKLAAGKFWARVQGEGEYFGYMYTDELPGPRLMWPDTEAEEISRATHWAARLATEEEE